MYQDFSQAQGILWIFADVSHSPIMWRRDFVSLLARLNELYGGANVILRIPLRAGRDFLDLRINCKPTGFRVNDSVTVIILSR